MNYLLVVISALLIILPVSHPEFFYVSWVALLPCLYCLRDQTPRRSFFLGWLMGTVIMAGSGYWLYFPLRGFSDLSLIVIIVVIGLLFVSLGIIYGLWAWLYKYIQGDNTVHPVFLAVSWVGIEYLRYTILSDFPFAFMGYTQVNFSPVIQLGAAGGIFFISFFVVLINGYLFKFINNRRIKNLIVVIIIFVGVVGYGYYIINTRDSRDYKSLQIGLIQTRIPQEEKWLPANTDKNLNDLMMKASSVSKSSLIITPETALTFDLVRNQYYRENFYEMLKSVNAFMQVGTQAIIEKNTEKYNSSFLLAPDNTIKNRYNKNRLVVFGEYLPLPFLIKKITGVNINSLTPGAETVIFETSFASWRTNICSEILHPLLVKENIASADFIVNQSNESWFGLTNLQQQMWTAAVMRAVENRRSVVKISNYGFSGYIQPTGIPELKTEIDDVGIYEVDVKLNQEETLYQSRGDYIGYGSLMFLLLIFLIKLYVVFRSR